MDRWSLNTVGTAGVSSSSALNPTHSLQPGSGTGSEPPVVAPVPGAPTASLERQGALTASQAYALKKRIFAPLWWLDGYLLKASGRDAFGAELLRQRENNLVVVGPDLAAKHMPLMFSIWNEFVSAAASGGGAAFQVRVPLDRILRGTGSEIAELVSVVETYWSSPFSLYQIQPAVRQLKKQKSLQMTSAGCINFVRHVRVEVASRTELVLDLMVNLADLCLGNMENLIPRAHLENLSSLQSVCRSALRQGFVSVNPDVLRAFGTGVSAKKLSSYLFIEQVKLDEAFLAGQSGWCGRVVASKELPSFHRDLVSRTKALYDHGIFGWENGAPPLRISKLTAQQNRDAHPSSSGKSAIVHCWKLSCPALDAAEMELGIFQKISSQNLEQTAARLPHHKTPLAVTSPAVGQFLSTNLVPTPSISPSLSLAGHALSAPAPLPKPAVKNTAERKERVENDVLPAQIPAGRVLAGPPAAERAGASAQKVRTRSSETQTLFDSAESSAFSKSKNTPFLPMGIRQSSSQTTLVQGAQNQGLAASAKAAPPAQALPLNGEMFEHEFLVRVAEFYDSLTPIQRLAFERQRSSMSPDQFRNYVSPILIRARRKGRS